MLNLIQRRRGWGVTSIFVAVILLISLNRPELVRAFTHYLEAAYTPYPAIPGSRIDNCNLCHHTDELNWPTLNSFGQDYAAHGYNFAAIANLDSDNDGYTNNAELTALSFPGDFTDRPLSSSSLPYNVYLPVVFKQPQSLPVSNGQYVILAWNDLGMHCMDPGFEDFAVLPPFNTLWAQVIRRGGEPQIVTNGVTVEYKIINNSYSAGKTNFWDYSQQLFGLSKPLRPNIGLKGFGLSGQMHVALNSNNRADHFVAEGIPLTEYNDSNRTTRNPYQMAELVAKDQYGNVLATTKTVTPVSTEMNCQNCHADNGRGNSGIATGVLKQNILTQHDAEEGTSLMAQRPVLCAGCHSSNALGAPGKPGLPSLSQAMHRRHQQIDDFTMEGTCYQCHPGPETKCLRGAMYQADKTCQDCHGNMSDVANPSRRPWLDEPRCADCHDSTHSENPGMLYRFSTGHGRVYCQACHGSQHAIYPSLQPADNMQSLMQQGHVGTIDTCTVCHTRTPDKNEGPHQDDD
jgi:hypothetical protein